MRMRRARATSSATGRPRRAAEAFYELGEIRLRTGALAGAENAFRQAHELGRQPAPGLALLQLMRGDANGAAVLLDRALAKTRGTGWHVPACCPRRRSSRWPLIGRRKLRPQPRSSMRSQTGTSRLPWRVQRPQPRPPSRSPATTPPPARSRCYERRCSPGGLPTFPTRRHASACCSPTPTRAKATAAPRHSSSRPRTRYSNALVPFPTPGAFSGCCPRTMVRPRAARSCSLTWSGRPRWPARSAMKRGALSWLGTTACSARCSPSTAARR